MTDLSRGALVDENCRSVVRPWTAADLATSLNLQQKGRSRAEALAIASFLGPATIRTVEMAESDPADAHTAAGGVIVVVVVGAHR